MDATLNCTNRNSPRERRRQSRREAAEEVARFEELDSPWVSRAQIARELGVPARTLCYRIRRKRSVMRRSSWPHDVARFFETPHGLDFLERLLTAAHLVFVQANDCGLRNLSWFIELSGLDQFIAPSYGAQQAVAEEVESLLIHFGQEEGQRLGAQMPPRTITVCEDETFHPQICLVGIEPVSDFILLEQYQPQRDAPTWNQCLDDKLAGLPVTVIQVTSDQAKAIIAHTEMHLGAHHSPDLFHVQQDTVRATGAALAGQTQRAEQELEKAEQKTVNLHKEQDACQQQCPGTLHAQVLQQQRQQAEADEASARRRAAECRNRQERARVARRALGQDYHPFDLNTGQPLTAEEVASRLAGHFDTLEQVAREAGLSTHAEEKLAKARRVLDSMQATVAFFWTIVATWFTSWDLGEAGQRWMREELIPGYYFRRAAKKAATSQERKRLRELSEKILARARSPDGFWGTLSPQERSDWERKAEQCADVFQRSSSCVEGRNGQLSLRHHGLHQLTKRKLGALTVLHNYTVRHRDGSTAAERFYGTMPRDVFAWLLERISLPTRPRAVRRAA